MTAPTPAYLADGERAFPAAVVATWPEHNRSRMKLLLYTGEQLDAALAAAKKAEEPDLTVAYMAGFERGKDAARATIAAEKAEPVTRSRAHEQALYSLYEMADELYEDGLFDRSAMVRACATTLDTQG